MSKNKETATAIKEVEEIKEVEKEVEEAKELQTTPDPDANKIDIIIPAYNAGSTLERCLHSIAMQTIKDDLKVTIVDDASTVQDNGNYHWIMEKFKDTLDINLIRSDVNQGPGVSRQIGIDKTNYPFLMFIDADDTFATAFSLQQLRSVLLKNPNCFAVWSTFIEETTTGELIEHTPAPVWMFGKIYRRKFWEENNIKFHPRSRYNEDTGVNSMMYLLKNNTDKVLLYAKSLVTYYWHNNKNTITKINNTAQAYWDDRGFYGFVQNRLWTLDHVLEYYQGKNDGDFNCYIIQGLMFMYCYYNSAKNNKSYLLKDIILGIQLYYDRYCKSLLPYLKDAQCAEMLKKCIEASNPIMYNMTWKDFVKKLDEKTLGVDEGIEEFSKVECSEEDMYPEKWWSK